MSGNGSGSGITSTSTGREGVCPACDQVAMIYAGTEGGVCLACHKLAKEEDNPSRIPKVDDQTLVDAVRESKSWAQAANKLNMSDVAVRGRATKLGVDLGKRVRAPNRRNDTPTLSDEEFAKVVETSPSWAEAARRMDRDTSGVRQRGKNMGVVPLNGGRIGSRGAKDTQPSPNGNKPVGHRQASAARASEKGTKKPRAQPRATAAQAEVQIEEHRSYLASVGDYSLELDEHGVTIMDGNDTWKLPPGFPAEALRTLAVMAERLEG
jgi:hypothetical protein